MKHTFVTLFFPLIKRSAQIVRFIPTVKRWKYLLMPLWVFAVCAGQLTAQTAKIYEETLTLKTYPFSDPDPVPEISRIYPYFSFDGYTNHPVDQKWKMVVLENDYIKVYVCPEIGGKVWGAIEKSTGNEFLYFNHVAKFRNVAMRGPWTSGGLEFNFGAIGHVPTCSTPVDYIIKKNADGSVSCIVGALDLPSGTKWNVEITVSPGKAFFETKARWFNNTSLPTSYYHWMNAAAKSSGNLEFIYPGFKTLGHGGEPGEWPVDEKGRKISWYENNDFGTYKSYHVTNAYTEFFGGYWHDDDFGFGHWGTYDDKPGKKIWIWGLSQQGMIWEDLLTDNDGQYIEFQAGKLFNQAANSSTLTPFKHKEFQPHDGDIMEEAWFPVKETGGMVAASPFGVLNIKTANNSSRIILSALQPLNDELKIYRNGELIHSEKVTLTPLEHFETPVEREPGDHLKIMLGDNKLIYSSKDEDIRVKRPVTPNSEFNWNSAYGLYTKGLEVEKQRRPTEAFDLYMEALEKDPGFLPAINRVALAFYRQRNNPKALEYINKALSIDTYDGEANYIFGLINRELNEMPTAKSGFSIAMGSPAFRVAAATELAEIFLTEKNYPKAEKYASEALDFNQHCPEALKILAILYRKTDQPEKAETLLTRLNDLDPTDHFYYFERFLSAPDPKKKARFQHNITNELPHESYLDLAINYYNKGCREEARAVLQSAPEHPVVNLWLAALDEDRKEEYLNRSLKASPAFVLPHRRETATILSGFLRENDHWKLKYYQALISLKNGLPDEATALLNSCGDAPDYAPFWMLKAEYMSTPGERQYCLEKARHLAPDDWRASLALANFYLENGEPQKNLEITGKLLHTMPEQSSIGLSYARALVALEKYEASVAFLEEYEVLPYEGATEGRNIFHESCMRLAFEALKNKNYTSAVKYARKAKEWPVNLGVGKPYDVDERLEDYILAKAYQELGDEKQSGIYANRVMNYVHPDYTEENAKLLLQLKLLKEKGEEQKANELLSQTRSSYPENVYVQWVEAVILNKSDVESLEKEAIKASTEIQPYDTKFVDKEFKLLLDFLNRVCP